MMVYLIFVFIIIANAGANILFKIGFKNLPNLNFQELSPWLKMLSSPFILLGLFLFVASFPFYNFVLQKISLSVFFPSFMAAAALVVVLVSHFYLKEPLHFLQIFGMLLVLTGIWLLYKI